MLVVDTIGKAETIASACQDARTEVGVLIDVDPGVHRTGVAPGEPALALARRIGKLAGIEVKGVQCYDGLSQHVQGFARRREQVLAHMAPVSDTVALLRQAGFDMGIYTGGGTGTYNIDHEHPGFTDVQCGSYVFMDAQYLAIGKADGSDLNDDFLPSLSVVTTILANNADGLATADAGTKALTCDEPDPIVIGAPDVNFHTRSDEFGMVRFDQTRRQYRPGDQLELIVPHVDPVVNLFDRLVVTRQDRVVDVWPVAARGYA
jgi:D-serine deaminase-like pyridoxal phosphate-dependent protein